MMIGDAMTPFDPPFDPVLVVFFDVMLFNFEFDVTVFDVPVFNITLLYLNLENKNLKESDAKPVGIVRNLS